MIVTIPTGSITLTPSITFEGWVPLEYLWEEVTGDVTISDPTSLSTDISFASPGNYVVRFTAFTSAHASVLGDIDGNYIVTESGQYVAVQGHGGEGFSEAVTNSTLINFTVVEDEEEIEISDIHIGGDLSIIIEGVERVTGNNNPIGVSLNSIEETQSHEPNSASITCREFVPSDYEEVIISLDGTRIFAGIIIRDGWDFEEKWDNRKDEINVVDYSWHLTRRRLTASFVNKTVSEIVTAILVKRSDFHIGSIQTGLPLVTISFDNTTLADALTAVCDELPDCDWKVDYFKNISLGQILPGARPDTITFNHESVEDFTGQSEAGLRASQIRVFGASASSAAATKAQILDLQIQPAPDFGKEGSKAIVTGLRKNEDDPDFNPSTPDLFETSFASVLVRPKSVTKTPIVTDPNDVLTDGEVDPSKVDPSMACLSPEELLRQTEVKVKWRPIRVDAGGHSGTVITRNYYTTYETDSGESAWKEQIHASLGPTGAVVMPGPGTSTGPASLDYNAVEFIAESIPPTVSRINIYRARTSGKAKLIGSLTSAGTFGQLGHNTGQGPIIPGILVPTDIGVVITPSTNSVVDSATDEELEDAQSMPDGDATTPQCGPDESEPLPDAGPPNPDDPSNPNSNEPEQEWFLTNIYLPYDIPEGATITRYEDAIDSSIQSYLASKLHDDGIIEAEPLRGQYISRAAMLRAGATWLRKNNLGELGATWSSRDRKSHPGLIVGVYVPPHCQGEFVIKTVNITQWEPVMCDNGLKVFPIYEITAEPKHLSLSELLP